MSSSSPQSSHPPEAWKPVRRAAAALASPIQRILAVEAASGIILLAATAAALVWANVAPDTYHHVFETKLGLTLGGERFERSLHFWINEGLMTVFFFVVGLEIRREIYEGELATVRQAALPFIAALGGMVVPALVFVALNAGREGVSGWAVPMATDIAFAVGVLTLLGRRVPGSMRVLLLALAVIDDIGAIVVIALVFNAGMSLHGVAISLAALGTTIALRGAGVRSPLVYIIPGILLWIGLFEAGIHPTLDGVLLGLLTPVRPWFGPSGFAETTKGQLADLDAQDRDALLARLDEIEIARREAVSPVDRLVHSLHPWVAFVIMPVFALANAGVALGGADLGGDALWVFLGIAIALPVGKLLGIAGFSLGATKLRLAVRPAELGSRAFVVLGLVGGVGFTMSLFIAQLAFPPGPLLETAKLAVLTGSGIAIVLGMALGAALLRPR
jgi:NhaA family Na+:H+ antiporter